LENEYEAIFGEAPDSSMSTSDIYRVIQDAKKGEDR
jgi:hypothetical protein